MMTYAGAEVQLHSFLALTLHADELATSPSGGFSASEGVPGAQGNKNVIINRLLISLRLI
jgi:hypothetical protein